MDLLFSAILGGSLGAALMFLRLRPQHADLEDNIESLRMSLKHRAVVINDLLDVAYLASDVVQDGHLDGLSVKEDLKRAIECLGDL